MHKWRMCLDTSGKSFWDRKSRFLCRNGFVVGTLGTGLGRLAVIVLVVAGAFDLLGDSACIIVLPQAAALQPTSEPLFVVAERLMQIVSVVVANGFYSLGTLLLTLALRRGPELKTGTTCCAASGK